MEALFHQLLQAHSLGVLALAFLGGVVSSLLPCTVAMLPVVMGYVGAYSGDSRQQVLAQVALFILGSATVMTTLGVGASLLGLTFGNLVGNGWYFVVGAIAILMGLQLAGVLKIPFPQFVTQMPGNRWGRYVTPFVLGVAFGSASSPCGTPFLTAILGFISKEKNLLLGGSSLFFYSLGQGVLLLAVGLFTGLLKHKATLYRVGTLISGLSAGVFVLVGLMLLAQGAGVLGDILLFLHLL